MAAARSRSPGSSARSRRRRRRAGSGQRLFAFDRRLGYRLVAGADEAGRGCLAGPLVAAGVLFDYEALTTRELRSLAALNDSKQHTAEAREELYPLVLRSAARVHVVSRCVRGIDARGLHKTNLAALRDALRGVTREVRGRGAVPGGRLLGGGVRAPPAGDRGRRRHERRDRRRVDRGEGDARSLHAHGRRTPPGWSFAEHVGYSTPSHREAILRNGVSPLHRMSFQSLAYQQLAL